MTSDSTMITRGAEVNGGSGRQFRGSPDGDGGGSTDRSHGTATVGGSGVGNGMKEGRREVRRMERRHKEGIPIGGMEGRREEGAGSAGGKRRRDESSGVGRMDGRREEGAVQG